MHPNGQPRQVDSVGAAIWSLCHVSSDYNANVAASVTCDLPFGKYDSDAKLGCKD